MSLMNEDIYFGFIARDSYGKNKTNETDFRSLLPTAAQFLHKDSEKLKKKQTKKMEN